LNKEIKIGDEARINPDITCELCGAREVLVKTNLGTWVSNLIYYMGQLVCKDRADCIRARELNSIGVYGIDNGIIVEQNGETIFEAFKEK